MIVLMAKQKTASDFNNRLIFQIGKKICNCKNLSKLIWLKFSFSYVDLLFLFANILFFISLYFINEILRLTYLVNQCSSAPIQDFLSNFDNWQFVTTLRNKNVKHLILKIYKFSTAYHLKRMICRTIKMIYAISN